jgi:hypothetical protein
MRISRTVVFLILLAAPTNAQPVAQQTANQQPTTGKGEVAGAANVGAQATPQGGATSAGGTGGTGGTTQPDTKSTDTLEAQVASLKSGQLLRYGVTGGLAFAVQTGIPKMSSSTQKTAGVTAMPYILFVPAYWGYSEAKGMYCSTNWGFGSEDDAVKAAQFSSSKAAARKLNELWSQIMAMHLAKHDASQDDIRVLAKNNDVWDKLVETLVTAARSGTTDVTKVDGYATLVFELATDPDNNGWSSSQPLMRGKQGSSTSTMCFWSKLGLWVGKPISYTAQVRITDAGSASPTTKSRTVDPVVAGGLAFAPNSYVSIMAGIGYATAQQDDATNAAGLITAKGQPVGTWALTFALGGNLDIIGALAKPAN